MCLASLNRPSDTLRIAEIMYVAQSLGLMPREGGKRPMQISGGFVQVMKLQGLPCKPVSLLSTVASAVSPRDLFRFSPQICGSGCPFGLRQPRVTPAPRPNAAAVSVVVSASPRNRQRCSASCILKQLLDTSPMFQLGSFFCIHFVKHRCFSFLNLALRYNVA